MCLSHLKNLSGFFASRVQYFHPVTTPYVSDITVKILIISDLHCWCPFPFIVLAQFAIGNIFQGWAEVWHPYAGTIFLSKSCASETRLTCNLWWLTGWLVWNGLNVVFHCYFLYTILSRILSGEDLTSPKVVWLRFGSSVFSHAPCILIARGGKKNVLWQIKVLFCR